MNRCLVLVALFLLGIEALRASDASPASVPAPPNASTAPITDPALVSAHYRLVLARPEFQETGKPDVNTRFKEWLIQWFKRLGATFGQLKYAGKMPVFATMLMTVLAALSVVGLLYIMLRLTRRRGRMDVGPSIGLPGQKTFRPPEFYDNEIQAAIGTGDWHGAWLAAWRQFLSRLENRQLVEADRTRTNREYLAQLHAESLPMSALALLTGMVDAYDRFIYGRQSISESDWNHFHRQINEAGLLLHLDDKSAASRAKQGGA